MGDELSMRGKVNDECQDYLTSRTFYRVKENKFRAKQGFGTTIKKIFFFRITNERLDDFDESSKHLFLVSFEKH